MYSSDDEDEGPQYLFLIHEEEYEEEDVQGFSTKTWASSGETENKIVPWDPKETFFFLL